MAAARDSKQNASIDASLEHSFTRPASVKPPTPPTRKPLGLSFKEWAGSQVAAYRIGLVLGYLAMMYFGGQAFYAGIPTFTFTTPEGFTPIWATAVVLGGLIGAIGGIRAGTEPTTKQVRVFNGIELTGSILLFLTLGTYAAVLLVIGYGYGDAARSSIGAGFVALGVPHFIRMLWLILRPRFMKIPGHHIVAHGPVMLIPDGYRLVKIDSGAHMAKDAYETDSPSTGLKGD